jgi:hypothetical protein
MEWNAGQEKAPEMWAVQDIEFDAALQLLLGVSEAHEAA